MKSAYETHRRKHLLNLKPISTLSPLRERKEKEGKRSYRLRDSLFNGAVKPFTIVMIVLYGLPDVATAAGEIGHRKAMR
jgi:hypothetical protein